jgi:hypothetical protein
MSIEHAEANACKQYHQHASSVRMELIRDPSVSVVEGRELNPELDSKIDKR